MEVSANVSILICETGRLAFILFHGTLQGGLQARWV